LAITLRGYFFTYEGGFYFYFIGSVELFINSCANRYSSIFYGSLDFVTFFVFSDWIDFYSSIAFGTFFFTISSISFFKDFPSSSNYFLEFSVFFDSFAPETLKSLFSFAAFAADSNFLLFFSEV
jgi:hypothetical protein